MGWWWGRINWKPKNNCFSFFKSFSRYYICSMFEKFGPKIITVCKKSSVETFNLPLKHGGGGFKISAVFSWLLLLVLFLSLFFFWCCLLLDHLCFFYFFKFLLSSHQIFHFLLNCFEYTILRSVDCSSSSCCGSTYIHSSSNYFYYFYLVWIWELQHEYTTGRG